MGTDVCLKVEGQLFYSKIKFFIKINFLQKSRNPPYYYPTVEGRHMDCNDRGCTFSLSKYIAGKGNIFRHLHTKNRSLASGDRQQPHQDVQQGANILLRPSTLYANQGGRLTSQPQPRSFSAAGIRIKTEGRNIFADSPAAGNTPVKLRPFTVSPESNCPGRAPLPKFLSEVKGYHTESVLNKRQGRAEGQDFAGLLSPSWTGGDSEEILVCTRETRKEKEEEYAMLHALHYTHREATRLFLMATKQGATDAQISAHMTSALQQGRERTNKNIERPNDLRDETDKAVNQCDKLFLESDFDLSDPCLQPTCSGTNFKVDVRKHAETSIMNAERSTIQSKISQEVEAQVKAQVKSKFSVLEKQLKRISLASEEDAQSAAIRQFKETLQQERRKCKELERELATHKARQKVQENLLLRLVEQIKSLKQLLSLPATPAILQRQWQELEECRLFRSSTKGRELWVKKTFIPISRLGADV